MIFDPETMDATACYKLLIGSIVPRAIGWASTLSADGVANLAPFSFFTAVSRKPPMVSLTIQPRSDRRRLKDTLVNVQATGEFVVNIVSLPQVNAMHASSVEFEPEVDEFEAVGVSKAPSHLVKPSRVAGAPVSMECRLERIVPLGEVGDHLVIGRVVRFHVADALALEDGRVDTAGLQPVGRLAGEYVLSENIFVCPVNDEVLQARVGSRMRRLDDRDARWSPLIEKNWSAAGDGRLS